jgi:hypothetical protein
MITIEQVKIIYIVFTQPLAEMSNRNLSGCKARPARKAENLTAICEAIYYTKWNPRLLATLLAFMVCYRGSFTFFFYFYCNKFRM